MFKSDKTNHAGPRRSRLDIILPQNESDDDLSLTESQRFRRRVIKQIKTLTKIIILLIVWLFFTILIIIRAPREYKRELYILASNQSEYKIPVPESEKSDCIMVTVEGYINVDLQSAISENIDPDVKRVKMRVQRKNVRSSEYIFFLSTNNLMETLSKKFELSDSGPVTLVLKSDAMHVPLVLTLDSEPINTESGVIWSLFILFFLYVLIIWDITDRTFAAILAATASIGVLTLMHARPTLEKIVSWIDVNTLMLLFAMMLLVAILSITGVFDFLAVFAYKCAKGHAWPLIFFLCFFTALIGAFLDNVTMVLLMTPVSIRLCEVMQLRTTSVLISIVIFANLGGTLTPVGDPPNVIIASNKYVLDDGIDFVSFTGHMCPGVLLSLIVCFIHLRCVLGQKLELTDDNLAMRQSINAWRRQATKVQPTTVSEDIMRQEIIEKIATMKEQYRKKKNDTTFGFKPVPNFIETLVDLQTRYYIRDKVLLVKAVIALVFGILLFILHSFPFMKGVSLPWAALLAALLALILANIEDMQTILVHVEWSTLLFFAALFVLMEALSEMGLIDFIGDQTTRIIMRVDENHRMTIAIMLMLWISACASAFVDNIPITTMMLKLTIQLAKNEKLNLPLSPLVWALSFGTCFGGNGTLIGASANVVCAGISSQHGYKITFLEFLILGFPCMLISVLVASVYLLFMHVIFEWH